jgi:hypothetical protein
MQTHCSTPDVGDRNMKGNCTRLDDNTTRTRLVSTPSFLLHRDFLGRQTWCNLAMSHLAYSVQSGQVLPGLFGELWPWPADPTEDSNHCRTRYKCLPSAL